MAWISYDIKELLELLLILLVLIMALWFIFKREPSLREHK